MPGTSLLVGIGRRHDFSGGRQHEYGPFQLGHRQRCAAIHGGHELLLRIAGLLGTSPNNGPVVYLWGAMDFLKAYKFVGGLFQTTPVTQSTVQNSTGFSNSAPLSLSADGDLVGGGIVWSSASFSGLATGPSVPGILRAFDATNLTTELWDSKQNSARDDVGLYAKFNPPTVANGKVYVGSFSGQLLVYGLAPPAASGIQFVQVVHDSRKRPRQAFRSRWRRHDGRPLHGGRQRIRVADHDDAGAGYCGRQSS